MTCFSITEVEQAINYWRAVEGPHDDLTLGPRASQIADIYGTMIFQHLVNIAATDLDSSTVEIIDFALRQAPLPFN